jgi:hypothetical protein
MQDLLRVHKRGDLVQVTLLRGDRLRQENLQVRLG